MGLDSLIGVTREIHRDRYITANVILLAGSHVRGTATRYSDLDLVVIFDQLPNAYRESFYASGFPVEAFVHDPETLYFFLTESDRPTGMASLAQMIIEGIEVPGSSVLSTEMKALASMAYGQGPPRLTAHQIDDIRYRITGLIDDIRDPRSHAELLATGTELYNEVANFRLRTSGEWGAKGKSIPWRLSESDPDFAQRYVSAFETLFTLKRPADAIRLAEEIIEPFGGLHFDGYRREASPAARKELTTIE